MGLGVDQRAVADQELVGGEGAGFDGLGEGLAGGFAGEAGGAIFLADEDVADALLELAEIAGPGVVAAEVAVNEEFDFGGKFFGFVGGEICCGD